MAILGIYAVIALGGGADPCAAMPGCPAWTHLA
jgi:hypothetical protein